jgi:hypothetical protein
MVFLLPTSYAGSGLFSYFLTILGDFSWPFMTILAWPLTRYVELAQMDTENQHKISSPVIKLVRRGIRPGKRGSTRN